MRFAVAGTVDAAGLIEFMRREYPQLKVKRVLWDLRQADQSKLSETDLLTIAIGVRKLLPPEDDRKTAYVVGTTHAYTQMWQYITDAVKANVQAEYSVFMDEPAAIKWLRAG